MGGIRVGSREETEGRRRQAGRAGRAGAALALLVGLGAAAPAGAQDVTREEVERLHEELRELRYRLSEVEAGGGAERPGAGAGADVEGGGGAAVDPQQTPPQPGAGTGPAEPSRGEKAWNFLRDNFRVSITLNNFFVARDHNPISAAGPTGSSNTFTVGQFELDIWTEFPWGVDFRVDIDTTEDDRGIGGSGSIRYPDDLQLEQAYISVDLAKLTDTVPLQLVFGRFNAPMGLEPIDAPGLWQFSRSNLAARLTPANLVGFMARYTTDPIDVEAYIVNGWEVNDDRDKEKTGGGRVVLKLFDQGDYHLIKLAPAVIYGHEPTALRSGDKRLVTDVVLVLQPVDMVKVGLEYNYGHEEGPLVNGRRRGTWEAYLGSLNLRVTEWLAFTFRGEYIHDRGGVMTGAVQYLKSGTAAVLFRIPTGVDVIEELFINLEYRHDRSNRDIFTEDSPSTTGEELYSNQFAFQTFFFF